MENEEKKKAGRPTVVLDKEQVTALASYHCTLKQFDVAMKGNTTMLIWLGKQILGQNDQNVGEDYSPLPIDDIL